MSCLQFSECNLLCEFEWEIFGERQFSCTFRQRWCSLRSISRTREANEITFTITPRRFALLPDDGRPIIERRNDVINAYTICFDMRRRVPLSRTHIMNALLACLPRPILRVTHDLHVYASTCEPEPHSALNIKPIIAPANAQTPNRHTHTQTDKLNTRVCVSGGRGMYGYIRNYA